MLTKKEDLEMLKLYERLNACSVYELGLIYDKKLYLLELKQLPVEIIRVTTDSGKQKNLKFKLDISNKNKAKLLENNKHKVLMTEEKFLEKCKKDKLNRGQELEKLRTEARHQDYKLDNVRFDKAGDINLKRKKIQVKFENASLTTFKTILKVASEN